MYPPKKWSKWSSSLTEEELHLKSKYAELKAAKAMLSGFEETGRCVSPVQVNKAGRPAVNNNYKKCSDFKKALKPLSENNAKRFRPAYPTEDDTEPRSVNVRGEDLTDGVLRSAFGKHGDVRKIRINEEKNCAVLTFKTPLSAQLAVARHEGSGLHASLAKRKNTSWCDATPGAFSQIQNRGRCVRLSYEGQLNAKDLEDFFQYVGRVTRMYLNETKRFGFVTFETEEQARRAIKEMNGERCRDVRVLVAPQKFSGSDADKSNASRGKGEESRFISYSDVEIGI